MITRYQALLGALEKLGRSRIGVQDKFPPLDRGRNALDRITTFLCRSDLHAHRQDW